MTLYFKNIAEDQDWHNGLNWFTDAAATTQAATAPWISDGNGGVTYGDYDLTFADGEDTCPFIFNDIVAGVTGTCDMGGSYGLGIENHASIYGGNFSGDSFFNVNIIYGGNFSGAYFNNLNFSYIYGGNFSGSSFYNEGYIYGGTFSGTGFTNNNAVHGGNFSGSSFYNEGVIYGGTFSGANFYNSSDLLYGGIFSNAIGFSGNPRGGTWLRNGTITVHDATRTYRFSGNGAANPRDVLTSQEYGFMTIDIPGQDIIGSGLL